MYSGDLRILRLITEASCGFTQSFQAKAGDYYPKSIFLDIFLSSSFHSLLLHFSAFSFATLPCLPSIHPSAIHSPLSHLSSRFFHFDSLHILRKLV
jgi:hypothetical protein